MTTRKSGNKLETVTVNPNDPKDRKGAWKDVGGSRSDRWNCIIGDQVAQALWVKHANADERRRLVRASIAAMTGIGPRDELEGMMAAQLIAAHHAAMECYRRAMLEGQTFEGRRENLSQANKLSRTWAALLDALNKHRGKGQQKVTVEHVHVHAGGQAVVGAVEASRRDAAGGGVREKPEGQPHAEQIAHAPEPTLRSPHEARNAVPVAGDEER